MALSIKLSLAQHRSWEIRTASRAVNDPGDLGPRFNHARLLLVVSRVGEAVAVLDPVNAPDTWACIAGPDGSPVTIYEGSEEAILALETMAADLYQADLRVQWLYPSVGFLVLGLGALVVGTRREWARY